MLAAILLATVPAPIPVVQPQVVSTRPHDPAAFTQGLEWADGVLYESTGLYGSSTVRRVDPHRGEVLDSAPLPAGEFGEGLAFVPGAGVADRLVQLTWREGVAHVYDASSLAEVGTYAYDGEGWGLCFDGARFVMSDGTAVLTFRDRSDFSVRGQIEVTLDGAPLGLLNELECVGTELYANVWGERRVLRIDPATGAVTAVIDASGLSGPPNPATDDVLNGIAHDEEAGTFLLTGKRWPSLYEVQWTVPDGAEAPAGCRQLPAAAGWLVALGVLAGRSRRSGRSRHCSTKA